MDRAEERRLGRDLDQLEQQKADEYAPLGASLGGPPGGYPTLPNGQPAPYPSAPYGMGTSQFGAGPIGSPEAPMMLDNVPPPTAAFGPPPPAAPYGIGASAAGMGPIGSPEAPMMLDDQGVTPEMAHAAAAKVLPNGQPAPFYVDDTDRTVPIDEGTPALGPTGQALQGYTPPVMPTNQPQWHSPTPDQIAALPSQQPVDNWFNALTPDEQRAVGGPQAAQPRGGPISGGGGINPFGGGMEEEIQRLRQQYEQAVRGGYR